MKVRFISYLVILSICLLATAAKSDYLRVSRSANIRAEPVRDARIIERAGSGTFLQLLDDGRQSNGYYRVETVSAGRPGWIYRTLARRFRGEIPEPAPEYGLTDPLSDPTGELTATQRRIATRHLRLGKPQAIYERVREGYVLAQDGRLKIPLWVQYELNRDELEEVVSRGSRDFIPDASIPFGSRADGADYARSGYAKGHLAPARDMTRSERAMAESFILSNAAPQIGPGFNGATWLSLENAVRGWVQQRGTLTIITGPVFAVEEDSVKYRVIGENNVAVPTHFYKIIVDANDPDNLEALAFMMPNRTITGQHYSTFLTSIDEIEVATGLDFLSSIPTANQETVESRRASSIW